MYTRIQDNRCVEFVDFDPTGKFHASITWVEVPQRFEAIADYSWVLTEDGQSIMPSSNASLLDQMKAKVTELCELKKNGGITYDGKFIETDPGSRATMHTKVSALARNVVTEVYYKASGSFSKFTREEFEALAAAVFNHMQACEIALDSHITALDALSAATVDEILSYDVHSNWPV